MNSEKVKEIKKDIDFCTTKIGCEECSFMPIMASTNCRNELLKNCLTLINDLESENEKLKQDLKKVINMQNEFVQNLKTATKEVELNLARAMSNLLK
jgi:hypothetical protein